MSLDIELAALLTREARELVMTDCPLLNDACTEEIAEEMEAALVPEVIESIALDADDASDSI